MGSYPLKWDDLKSYEKQQGGYWDYTNADPFGEGKVFVRVKPENEAARNEGWVEIISDILPYHWRINPPGGKCSCGYETPLGRQTSEHVARLIVQAITRD